MFLMLLRDQTMDYKETKNVVEGLCEWEILDLENVKYLNFFNVSQRAHLFALDLLTRSESKWLTTVSYIQ